MRVGRAVDDQRPFSEVLVWADRPKTQQTLDMSGARPAARAAGGHGPDGQPFSTPTHPRSTARRLLMRHVLVVFWFGLAGPSARATVPLRLRERVNYTPLDPATDDNGDRYFSIVDRCGPTGSEVWLFARSSLNQIVMSRSIDGGLSFGLPRAVAGASYAAHNFAVSVEGHSGEAHRRANLLLIGGQSSAFNGFAKGVRAFVLDRATGDVTRSPWDGVTLFNGTLAGCVERRPWEDFKGICEFDGKFSLVRWGDEYLVYARANLGLGARHVQMTRARSSNLRAWRPFEQVWIDSMQPKEATDDQPGTNIYMMHVMVNPVDKDSLIGMMPVLNPWSARVALRSSLCLCFTRDGVNFYGLQAVLPVASIGAEHEGDLRLDSPARSLDHNAQGLLAHNRSHVIFYVQHDVPGISFKASPSLLVRYGIMRSDLRAATKAALKHLPMPAAPASRQSRARPPDD